MDASLGDVVRNPLDISLGTPLATPMSPISPESLDTQLLHELKLLQHALNQPHPSLHAGSTENAEGQSGAPPLLAVAKLVHGVARDQWERLRETIPGDGWCALELCPRETRLCAPHLADCEACDDPLTGALLAAPLLRQLHKETVRARRGHSQMALVVFSLEENEDEDMALLATLIRRHIQECDSLGLLDRQRLALVLPGAGLFKAQALLEEMLTAISNESLPRCTAGIAGGHPSDDGTTLLQQAVTALREAREQCCTLRVYRETSDPLTERKTLVRSDEKRFLFSGGDI